MNGLLAAYYADDFTGATDLMEALTTAGAPTVVFLRPPRPEEVPSGIRCVGVAGTTRTGTPDRIDAEVPRALTRLAALGAPTVLYKVCATFDSSPRVGSIGRAMDCAQRVFGQSVIPVVAGAPHLGRYCCFGNLFARHGANGTVFRLDRHPTMTRHPVTPMAEADLTRHLAAQTSMPVRNLSLPDLRAGAKLGDVDGSHAVVIDAMDESDLGLAGRLILGDDIRFAVGSSGAGLALARAWHRCGSVAAGSALPPPEPVNQLLVVSGSCSPITAAQLDHAERAGYLRVPLAADASRRAAAALRKGRSVMVCSQPREGSDEVADETSERVGRQLGEVAADLVARHAVPRLVVCGGDTCGQVARALEVRTVAVRNAVAPAAGLCRVTATGPADGLEIAFKGGQMGQPDYFERVRGGAAALSRTTSLVGRSTR
jgi:uncharacterized protein YgbK (DUF1537 family)